MKGVRFTEEQISQVLQQLEKGMPIKEVYRQHSIYRWKAKFIGMEASDAK
jgi:putative transposase